jgi:PAS domain S-box-containing protein
VPLLERRRRNAVRFLVVAVAVDVLLGACLRAGDTARFLGGARDGRAVLTAMAMLYLLVVVYGLVRVVRHDAQLRKRVGVSDARVVAMQDTSAAWLWETTPDLVLTYSSPQLTDLLGYAPSDIVGRDVHDLMDASTAKQSHQAVEDGSLTKGWRDWTSTWVHAEGRPVVLRHSGAPLRNSAGLLIGYRGSASAVPEGAVDGQRMTQTRQRIEAVISDGGLEVALQPIIAVGSGHMVGAEALARFPDHRAPNLWFDEAGAVGLRYELEMHAIRSALGRFDEIPSPCYLSLNASPAIVADRRFAATLLTMTTAPDRIVLEVTEHVRVDAYDDLRASLDVLRRGGIRLAVDDAGAGYASLAHVLQLRPDIVKLDRSLVTDVDSDRARRTLITALSLLALDIGATVTAEGVETAAELEALADLGIEFSQGYLIGRPSLDVVLWRTASTTTSTSP